MKPFFFLTGRRGNLAIPQSPEILSLELFVFHCAYCGISGQRLQMTWGGEASSAGVESTKGEGRLQTGKGGWECTLGQSECQ
jgi:hypothetical protein